MPETKIKEKNSQGKVRKYTSCLVSQDLGVAEAFKRSGVVEP
jgi:hypothetical protein